MPEVDPSLDGGSQPFDGRLGKLRYLGLALMAAASPVSREAVQLCISFPADEQDPFDFDAAERSLVKRAPVAYPILTGHVLTHTVGALIAVAGRARAEEGRHHIDCVVGDCRNVVNLGLVARVGQVILAKLRPYFGEDQQVCLVIDQMKDSTCSTEDPEGDRHAMSNRRVLLGPGLTVYRTYVVKRANSSRKIFRVKIEPITSTEYLVSRWPATCCYSSSALAQPQHNYFLSRLSAS